jgi:hypothetical protein
MEAKKDLVTETHHINHVISQDLLSLPAKDTGIKTNPPGEHSGDESVQPDPHSLSDDERLLTENWLPTLEKAAVAGNDLGLLWEYMKPHLSHNEGGPFSDTDLGNIEAEECAVQKFRQVDKFLQIKPKNELLKFLKVYRNYAAERYSTAASVQLQEGTRESDSVTKGAIEGDHPSKSLTLHDTFILILLAHCQIQTFPILQLYPHFADIEDERSGSSCEHQAEKHETDWSTPRLNRSPNTSPDRSGGAPELELREINNSIQKLISASSVYSEGAHELDLGEIMNIIQKLFELHASNSVQAKCERSSSHDDDLVRDIQLFLVCECSVHLYYNIVHPHLIALLVCMSIYT